MPPPMIDVQQLTKQFGNFTAVDHVSFTVQPGEIVGFLGPNGAGKTTTMKMLVGLLKPNSGSARICGHDIQKEPLAAKACLGWVPAEPNLYDKLNPVEYLRFIASLYRVPTQQAEVHIERMLDVFELKDSAGSRLEGFSHGMRQKVAVAAGLIHQPQILFLDEPTVGLDPRSARFIKDVMRDIRGQGRSVIFSTHILEIAEDICDRVMIIDKGRIIANGTLQQLRGGGDASLEDIFLQLTGGAETAEGA
jgi:ABC-2 type transport system ATP-binding protein